MHEMHQVFRMKLGAVFERGLVAQQESFSPTCLSSRHLLVRALNPLRRLIRSTEINTRYIYLSFIQHTNSYNYAWAACVGTFCSRGGARVVQWWEHSPPTNVARVQIPASTPYVGWVCCWFSHLLREVFLRVLRFSPLLKNQHVSTSSYELLSAPHWVNKLQFTVFINRMIAFHLNSF